MKLKYYFILILLFTAKVTLSQNFKTLEEFKTYFAEHGHELDPVEGLWNVIIYMHTDHVVAQPEEFLVAIMKKKDDYHQFMIEYDKYIPSADKKRFVKEYDTRCAMKTNSDIFKISNNQFSFDLEHTAIFNCYAKAKLADSVVKKYTYTKTYP
ncbi:hypothetical protein ACFLRZ_04140 [Bacteroidota bacterium]